MPNSRAIAATKGERGRKAHWKAVLREGGNEALFRELYRETLGGLIDLAYDFEDGLLARVEKLVPAKRRRAIMAEVDAEAEAELAAGLAEIDAEMERRRASDAANGQRIRELIERARRRDMTGNDLEELSRYGESPQE